MSDTPQRPDKPRFEPPPWERERFEELARRRAEKARAEAEPEAAGAGVEPEAGEKSEASGLDEKRVQAMFVQLAGEQSSSLHPIRRASKAVAGVMGAIGLSITVMAAVIGLRSQEGDVLAVSSAVIGAAIGVSIASLAVWLWSRTR